MGNWLAGSILRRLPYLATGAHRRSVVGVVWATAFSEFGFAGDAEPIRAKTAVRQPVPTHSHSWLPNTWPSTNVLICGQSGVS